MSTRFNTLRPLLSNYAIERRNKPAMLIGSKVAPMVVVDRDSYYYPIFGNEFITKSTSQGVRGNSARAERVDFSYSVDKYTTQEHAYETFLDDRDLMTAQPELRVEYQKTNIITDKQLIGYDAYVASQAFNVTTFSGYTAALSSAGATNTAWDISTSDPRIQAQTAKASILQGGLVDPESISLVVGADVWLNGLQFNATLLKTFAYTNPYALSTEMVAKALGIKEILVGNGIVADEQTGTKSKIWGKYAMFAYLSPEPSLEDVSTLKTFVLKDKDLRIDSYRDEPNKSTVYRSLWDYTVVAPAVSSGYLFSTVVS